MKPLINKFLFCCMILICQESISAEQTVTVRVESSFDRINLGNKVEILRDTAGIYTFNEILTSPLSGKFIRSDSDEPNFGFTSSVYWTKFQLTNPDSTTLTAYLEVSYPLIDSINLFVRDQYTVWSIKSSGDHYPLSSRDIRHRNFIFKLKLQPGTSDYYMRFKTTSSMNLPLLLWSENSLMNKIGTEQILFGIFFGAVIIMIIYNIFLFIGLKDISFIYLFIFIASWGFAQFTIDGLSFQYLWSGLPWWADVNLPVFIFISLAAAVQFCRSLLNTKILFPKWDKLLFSQMIIFIVGVIISFLLEYALSIRLAAGMAILAIISLAATGAAGVKRRNRSAVIFIAAWGLFLTGAILFAFKSFGILPSNVFTNFSVQIGFFAMMLLLSVAVQDRVETERTEKEEARENLIAALKESERVLEGKVNERTKEINRINVLLMERAIELAGIHKLTEKVNSSLRLEDVLMLACEEFLKIFNTRYSAVYLLEDVSGKFRLASYYSKDKSKGREIVREFKAENVQALKNNIDNTQPLFLPKPPDLIMADKQTGSVLLVPIIMLKRVVGVIVLPSADPAHQYSKDEMDLAKTMAVQVAGAVQNAQQHSETENALGAIERDLEIGREIQAGFFPAKIEQPEGWEIAARFKGARQVAGDFYDVFPLDNSRLTVFIIADVCDKGVGAALFMVLFRSLLRAYSMKNISTNEIQAGIARVISETNNYIAGTHNSSNMFASLFFGIIDHSADAIYYVNAGHDAPVILDKKGSIKSRLSPTGPVVGMFPEMKFNVEKILLERGEILFTYTDGSTDARDGNNKLFTEEKLLQIAASPHSSVHSMLYDIQIALSRHTGTAGQFDDITQLAVRRKLSNEDNIYAIERVAYPENLAELRNFVEETALLHELDPETVYALKLSAEEICSNIIRYGFGEEKGRIKISLELNPSDVQLNIMDNGIHFPPGQAEIPDLQQDYHQRKIGGLGIHLVKEMMDEVTYARDGSNFNLLTLKKYFNNIDR